MEAPAEAIQRLHVSSKVVVDTQVDQAFLHLLHDLKWP
jgi:hypothetical protein